MARSTFLFVLWNGGGNVPPMLRIGERLVAAGHRVHVLGNSSLRAAVERAGLCFSPFVRGPDHDPTSPETDTLRAWGAASTAAAAGIARDRLLFGPASAIARDTCEVIARIGADVVAVDYVVFGGLVGAEASGLPTAVLVPHIYPLVHRGTTARGTFSYMFERLIAGGLDALNRVRREFGLDGLAAAREQYARAGLMVLTTYETFDPPDAGVLSTSRYVGPQLPLPRQLPPRADDGNDPLVVLSFSTAWQNQEEVVRALLGQLSQLPVRALFLTGPALGRQRFEFGGNVMVRDFVPHAEVLPRAAALVCHGGHGTVMGALCHGVPLLCVPFEQDQFDVARRVVQLGAGISLSRSSSPAAMRSALQQILGEPQMADGAMGVRARFLVEDDSGRAVQELESLCGVRNREAAPAQ